MNLKNHLLYPGSNFEAYLAFLSRYDHSDTCFFLKKTFFDHFLFFYISLILEQNRERRQTLQETNVLSRQCWLTKIGSVVLPEAHLFVFWPYLALFSMRI